MARNMGSESVVSEEVKSSCLFLVASEVEEAETRHFATIVSVFRAYRQRVQRSLQQRQDDFVRLTQHMEHVETTMYINHLQKLTQYTLDNSRCALINIITNINNKQKPI